MALEALSSSELLNFIIYDNNNTFSATPFTNTTTTTTTTTTTNDQFSSQTSFFLPQQQLSNNGGGGGAAAVDGSSCFVPPMVKNSPVELETTQKLKQSSLGVVRKKRKRKPKVCKDKEEAETQRMTHIAVERNRRKQMNEHLAVLRSLMPQSYVQRGDQASIVGGAIEYVKTLENMLQSVEVQKFQTLQQRSNTNDNTTTTAASATTTDTTSATATPNLLPTPFAQFFTYPQYTCSQFPNNLITSKSTSNASIANIEVTLIETHANVRILCRRRVRQLSKMVSAFQTLYLNILHLNITTLDPLVLYSISAKVEEGCQFNSADDIANAVHHMLLIIENEALIPIL